MLEQQAEQGHINLYYGDETAVSELGYSPYGWQFQDEEVCIKSMRGKTMNYFGLLSRDNHFLYRAFDRPIKTADIIDSLEQLATGYTKPTVVILDNARIHTSKAFQKCIDCWQHKNLYIFHLPPYSPHLNIIERFWKELKEGWLRPDDYETADSLFYAVNRVFSTVGDKLKIQFAPFKNKW